MILIHLRKKLDNSHYFANNINTRFFLLYLFFRIVEIFMKNDSILNLRIKKDNFIGKTAMTVNVNLHTYHV